MEQFGPETSKAVANNLGINQKDANALIPEVIPLIFGGLLRRRR